MYENSIAWDFLSHGIYYGNAIRLLDPSLSTRLIGENQVHGIILQGP